MAKPSITLRETKGTPLSYSELDTNFENLRDATITVSADGNSIVLDLNDTLTLTPGTNVTFGVVGNTITVNAPTTGGVTLSNSSSSDQQYLLFNQTSTGNTTTLETDIALYYYPDTNTLVVGKVDTSIVDVDTVNPATGTSVNLNTLAVSTNIGFLALDSDDTQLTLRAIYGSTVEALISLSDSGINFSTGQDLSITHTGKFVLPNYTVTARDNLTNVLNGTVIYNTSSHKVQARAEGVWVDLH